MKTSEIISTDVKALNPTTTIKEIKKTFKKTTFTHLPIIDENKIVGLISETDIHTLENENDQMAAIMEIVGIPPRSLIAKATRRKVFFDDDY